MPEHKAPSQYAPHSHQPSFGPFKLIRTLGEGEFGKVKLATDTRNGREIAIKLLKKERLSTPAKRSKVMREISMLQALDHPYVVSLIEVHETDAYIGLVMENASGGEMFHYIMAQPDGKLKEPEGRRFFAQLVTGVSYIHSVGIVHRDLKLENLLLDKNNNLLISDFGFANKNSEHMETSCGSPGYAAPELVISNGYVGDSADIWSCGVILYGMLCGYLPYDDDPANPESENINLLYQYILQTKLTYPNHVSPLARGIIGLMLVPDPANRGKMGDVMGHSWLAPEAYIFEEELARRMKKFGYAKNEDTSVGEKDQQISENENAAESTINDDRASVAVSQLSAFEEERRSSSMARQSSSQSANGKYTSWFWGKKPTTSGTAVITTVHTSKMTPKIDDSVALSTSDGVSSLGRTSSVGRNSMHYAYSLSNSVNGVIKDRVLRVHTGPVDQKARSMRDPLDLLMDLEALFEKYGWIIETNGSTSGEYKLRVVKPRGVKVPGADSNVPDTSKQNVGENASEVTAVDVPAIQQDPKMTQIVESLPVTLMKRIRNFVYTLGPSASKGYDGSKSNVALSKKAVTGMEEEMTFNVEIKRVRETKRSLVVEFRRVKGDVWGFKRLYVSVIDKLPLSDN